MDNDNRFKSNNLNNTNQNPSSEGNPSSQIQAPQKRGNLGSDGRNLHYGGSNTEFDRDIKPQNDSSQKPSDKKMQSLKNSPHEMLNKGKEAVKNLGKKGDKSNSGKKGLDDQGDDKKKGFLGGNPLKGISPFNALNHNRGNENPGGNAAPSGEGENEPQEKSGLDMMNDGIKNLAGKTSSIAKKAAAVGGDDSKVAGDIFVSGKIAVFLKALPFIIIGLLLVGFMLLTAIFGTSTGEAASIADISDVDYYFSDEFDGDFSKLDDKKLKKLFERMTEAKNELSSEGASFDHIMVMATIDAILEADNDDSLTFKSFSKRDIKKISKYVSGKSDDEIKAAIADIIAPKYIKLNSVKSNNAFDEDAQVETTTETQTETETESQTDTTATTSKGYKIEYIDGVFVINNIQIANKSYKASSSYNPGGLNSDFTNAFDTMKAAAAKQGLKLEYHSKFRSYEEQESTYNSWVSRLGKAEADKVSSRAGHSEHQLGNTADINSVKDEFANTPEGKWLNANCYKYGFIIRYPKGKESYTGYSYEPWHIRYVGKDLAKELYNNGNWISLEEYLGITSDYNKQASIPSTSSNSSTSSNTTTTVVAKNKGTKYYSIAEHAIELRDLYYAYIGKANECITGGSCNYNIKGFSAGSSKAQAVNVNNLKVRLMQSSRTGGTVGKQLQGTDLVDFEKYVLGVAYAEIGCPTNENYFKTQLVAARSFALSRPAAMGNSQGLKLSEENGQWVLQIRSSVDDQQYCDPDLGCSYDPCGKNIERCQMWAGTSHGKLYKGPLEPNSNCRKWASDTIGEVLVDNNGYIINTGYKSAEQKKFSTSTNYKSTLISHYSNANTIDKANCNAGGESLCAYGVSTGDFANWTQKCDECRNVPLGNSSVTIYSAGCLATSVAMLIAKSGADTSLIEKEYGAFNHVTFVKALNKVGGFVHGNLQYGPISKVVPNFQYVDKNDSFDAQYPTAEAKAKHLQDLINQGYYVALQVKCTSQGTHFVALDAVQNGHVYIMDPATNSKELWTSNSSWKNQHCTRAYVRFRKM